MSNSISGNNTVLFGPEPDPGDNIGGYKLLKKLGQGGMGHVWKVEHLATGMLYAMKLLPPVLAADPRAWNETLKNFQLVSKLNHQHICPLHVLDRDPKQGPYLVMAFIDGISLDEYRDARGTFTADEVSSLLRPVAEALDFAHSQGVIHRDVKHDNIILQTPDGGKTITGTFVIDFGLAAQVRSSISNYSQHDVPLAGTIRYMAPETWRGRPAVAQTDQYALTVIAYRLLAGHYPFDCPDRSVMREAVLNEQIDAVKGLAVQGNAALVTGCSKKPDERFDTCISLVRAMAATPMVSTAIANPGPIVAAPVSRDLRVEVSGRGKFASIKEAIAAAKHGDSLVLDPGTYDEDNLIVGCKLKIASKDQSRKSVITASQSNVIFLQDGVEFEMHGIAIQARLSAGDTNPFSVVSTNNASIVVRDCELSGKIHGGEGTLKIRSTSFRGVGTPASGETRDSRGGGIDWRRGKVEVDGCQFNDFDTAILLDELNADIHASEFRRCSLAIEAKRSSFQFVYGKISHCKVGLEIRECSDFCHITESTIQDSGPSGTGIDASRSDVYLKEVKISRIDGSGVSGFDSKIEARNCEIQTCETGIEGSGRTGGEINVTETTIEKCGLGVRGGREISIVIHEGQISNCREDGVHYSGRLEVFRSQIRNNLEKGINSLRSASPAYITLSDLTGNREGAYRLPEGSDVHDTEE